MLRTSVLLFSLASGLLTADAAGNLLNNPAFRLDNDGCPYDWNLSFETCREALRFGDAGGTGTVTLVPFDGVCNVFQTDIRLKEGGRYRLGAEVRTRNCRFSAGSIVVYNWSWSASVGTASFPKDTNGQWVRLEADVTIPASRMGYYTFGIYTTRMTQGEIDVRSPSLVALDEASAAAAEPAPRLSEMRTITPLSPLLGKLSEGDVPLTLSYLGMETAGVCRVSLRMDGEADFRPMGEYPLSEGIIRARLTSLRAGRGTLRTELRAPDGKQIAASAYAVRVRLTPVVKPSTERRLNTLVSRLLTSEAVDGEVCFVQPREGWVWISLAKGSEKTEAFLDGADEPVIRFRPRERFETMRRLSAGSHVLRIKGAAGGELVINAIPALSAYTVPIRFFKGFQPTYGGRFCDERILPTINTFSMGYTPDVIRPDEMANLRSRGTALYGQSNHWRPSKSDPLAGTRAEPPERFANRLLKSCAMTHPVMSGLTFDEIFATDVLPKMNFAQTLRLLATAPRPVCTWSSGYTYSFNALNREFLSAAANASDGEGRLFFECYPWTKRTEAEMETHLDVMLSDTMRRADRLMPGFARSAGIHMGLYAMPGRMSYDQFDGVDFKVIVDRFWRRLATDPLFMGLSDAGIYAYNNAAEEDVRWTLAVIRHYAIEGRTDPLAERYGFRYESRHIRNAEFVSGLENWRVNEAEPGSVRVRKVKGWPRIIGYRNTHAEEACVLRRSAIRPNTIGQTIENLVPGRQYTLRYAVHSTNGVFDVSARLDGAKDVTADSQIAANQQTVFEKKDLSVRYLVFEAQGRTASFELSDWTAKEPPVRGVGEESVIGAVRVRPYYAE